MLVFLVLTLKETRQRSCFLSCKGFALFPHRDSWWRRLTFYIVIEAQLFGLSSRSPPFSASQLTIPNTSPTPHTRLKSCCHQLSLYFQREASVAAQEKYEQGVGSCGSICNISCGGKRSMSDVCTKSLAWQQHCRMSWLELLIFGWDWDPGRRGNTGCL